MESNKIDIDLYMGTATFFVNVESAATKTTYRGPFKVKCLLNAFDYIKADATFRELLGEKNAEFANDYVTQLCYAFSQLKHRVIEHPAWFRDPDGIIGGGLEDNVVLFVLEKCVEAEDQYRKGIEAKYKKSKGEVKKAIDDADIGPAKEPDIKDEETLGDQ
jgi:hypothetical protein